jgi:hypothetical protein
MAKLILADLNNLSNEISATNIINDNSAATELALENTLSRDGTDPNQMEADFDMNSFRILNLPPPIHATDPVRLQDVVNGSVDLELGEIQAADITFVPTVQVTSDNVQDAIEEISNILPTKVADTFLQVSSDASEYLSKTASQVRSALESISISELPQIEAWNNGVPGDGTDQTVALQALVDSLPTAGGIILLKGIVDITSLDLHNKHNICIKGISGMSAGVGPPSILKTSVGATTGRIIDCRDTGNVSFENLFLYMDNTAFNVPFVDYGLISSGSALMHVKDCCFFNNGTSASCCISLYGATQGSFRDVLFSGFALKFQNVNGVGFCNVMNFTNCNFVNCTGYPVFGSCEATTFLNCNVQAGPDGVGRFWQTSLNQDVRGISLIGCAFYDVLTAGGEWIDFYRGNALNVIGCRFGGPGTDNYNAALVLGGGTGGVHGVMVIGNNFDGVGTAVGPDGTSGAGTNPREVFIGSNYCFGVNPTVVSSPTFFDRLTLFPNYVEGHPNALGSHLNLGYAIPTSSSGLQVGDVYSNSGVLTLK